MPKVSADYRERRGREILDAAVDCFAAKGFYQTSMQDIVAASGSSPGATRSSTRCGRARPST